MEALRWWHIINPMFASHVRYRFDAIKTMLRLGTTEPLVRTEEMVQSNTANLPISNGTLFLTDRYLCHQVCSSNKGNTKSDFKIVSLVHFVLFYF